MEHTAAVTLAILLLPALATVFGDALPKSVEVCVGEGVRIRLVDVRGLLESCNVTAPSGETTILFPGGDEDSQNGSSKVSFWDSGAEGEKCGFRIDQVSAEDVGYWILGAQSDVNSTSSKVYIKASECDAAFDRKMAFVPGAKRWTAVCGSDSSTSCLLRTPEDSGGLGESRDGRPLVMKLKSCIVQGVVPFNNLAVGDWTCDWTVKGSMKGRSSKTSISSQSALSVGVEWRNSSQEGTPADVSLWCNWRDRTSTVRMCRWVQPTGEVLYPSEGLALGRYAYFGRGLSKGDCGISIRQQLIDADVGVWRCEIYLSDKRETPRGGYLELGIPRRTRDQKMRTIRSWAGAWDRGGSRVAVAVAGRALILGCSAEASLSFCVLVHPNGTRIMPSSAMNSSVLPYGRGRELGDCGVTIAEAAVEDSGEWKCTVGVDYGEAAATSINVRVYGSSIRSVSVDDGHGTQPATLTCESVLGAAFEHCRFERPDGTAFVVADAGGPQVERMPSESGVRAVSNLTDGVCSATLASVSAADVGTWACVGRIEGEEEARAEFIVSAQGVSGATISTISAMVVAILAFFAIAAAVLAKLYKRKRSTASLAEAIGRQRQLHDPTVTYRRRSDESSEGSIASG